MGICHSRRRSLRTHLARNTHTTTTGTREAHHARTRQHHRSQHEMTKKNNNDMMKLTEVVSSLRGATLAWQVLCSLVAFSALAQRDALTGEAQITGLSVYLALFVGAAGGRPPLVTCHSLQCQGGLPGRSDTLTWTVGHTYLDGRTHLSGRSDTLTWTVGHTRGLCILYTHGYKHWLP